MEMINYTDFLHLQYCSGMPINVSGRVHVRMFKNLTLTTNPGIKLYLPNGRSRFLFVSGFVHHSNS